MYFYSEIAKANIAAAEVIAKVKVAALDATFYWPYSTELARKFAIVDELEADWRYSRYLGFIYKLAKLRDYAHEVSGYGTLAELLKFQRTLNEALVEMQKHEDTLFEFMSSRGDASFNECTNLYKWNKLKCELKNARNAPDLCDEFMSTDPDFEAKYLTTQNTQPSFTEKDIAYANFLYWLDTRNTEFTDFSECNGLLSEMVYAIQLADYLLEYEQENDSDGIRELHAAFKEIGVFDKWRKF